MAISAKKFILPVALVVAAVAGWAVQRAATGPGEIEGFIWPVTESLEAFELRDHKEQPFDLSRIKGRWTLWYFGYTNCPDACPTALTDMRGIEGALRETDEITDDEVQYVFVSVDPERDTTTHLADYVSFFSSALVGATGNDEQLKELSRQLGVLYVLGEPDEQGDYLVDHSTYFFLTDPQARWVGLLRPQETNAEELATRLLAIRRAVGTS